VAQKTGAFREFCEGFTEELNRLRREQRAEMALAPRELAAINRRSKEILELLLSDFRDEAWKVELQEIQTAPAGTRGGDRRGQNGAAPAGSSSADGRGLSTEGGAVGGGPRA
jgi:hypothetical protein